MPSRPIHEREPDCERSRVDVDGAKFQPEGTARPHGAEEPAAREDDDADSKGSGYCVIA
jgi:hypothetical protein